MTIGIYVLKFPNTDKVYIGQSNDIESRYTRHLRSMFTGTSSIKLNLAYQKYGKPTFDILCECSYDELDTTENEAIEIYNSVSNGFNTYNAARGYSMYSGSKHYNSKYTYNQIEECFFLLLDSTNSIKYISEITGISQGSINVLSRGMSHKYLKELYPNEYESLISLVGSRRRHVNSAGARGIEYPSIICPQGTIYTDITNLKEFAKIHNLPYDGLHRVMNKSRGRISVKGWKLV